MPLLGRMLGSITVTAAAAVLTACAGATASDGYAISLVQPLPFADGTFDGSLTAGDIPDLMRRPVAPGADPGAGGVRLANRDGASRVARTCEDYLELLRSGWFADTRFDAATESPFNFTCVTLAFLAEATRPERSFIAAPRIGVGDIALVSASVLPAPTEEARRLLAEEAAGGGTVADHIDQQAPSTTLARHLARYRYRGVEQTLTELARADFDGDGVEDVLVFVDERTPDGRYRAAYHLVLTRTAADGPLSPVSDRRSRPPP